MPSCWILMAFNCLKHRNHSCCPRNPSPISTLSHSWIVSTIVLNSTLCWLRTTASWPTYWSLLDSVRPASATACSHLTKQHSNLILIYATRKYERERNPISQLTSRIPDILHPSPAPSPRTGSHPQRFELITLASIGRFHIYMLLTRALACNGNWVSRSTHERVGQMDRSLCPTIPPHSCRSQPGSLFRSNNWKLSFFFWYFLFVLFSLCQDSFKHAQSEPVPGLLSNTLSIEKHNFHNLCLSFHLYRCMSVVSVVVVPVVVVAS